MIFVNVGVLKYSRVNILIVSFSTANRPILMLYTDGGPDHRLTYHSVKLSLIALFIEHDLDMPIVGRAAPSNSWANPVERIMSIINLGTE